MAATKLLHAWNPRLFVIVDDRVMENFVLRHSWIREEIEHFEAKVSLLVNSDAKNPPRQVWYLAILL